jgi:hypothetical protein
MKASPRLFVLIALFALGAACWSGFGSSAQEKGKGEKGEVKFEPPKWEYKVTYLPINPEKAEKELNKMGDEGWELVGITASGPNNLTMQSVYKRPKK